MELFGLVCSIFAMLLSVGSLVYYGFLLLSLCKRAIYRLFFLLHALWLFYEIIDIYSQYQVTASIQLFIWTTELDSVLNYSAMLITVLVNAFIVMTVVFKPTLIQRVLVYLGLCVLHVGLAGSQYVTFLSDETLFLANWSDTTSVYWAVFMFLFDAAASLLCAVHIVRSYDHNESKWSSLLRTFSEPRIIASFLGQLFIMIVYYFIYCVVQFTTWNRNDRGDSALQYGAMNLLLSLHAIISTLNFDHFTLLMKKVKGESKEVAKDRHSETTAHSPVPSLEWKFSLNQTIAPDLPQMLQEKETFRLHESPLLASTLGSQNPYSRPLPTRIVSHSFQRFSGAPTNLKAIDTMVRELKNESNMGFSPLTLASPS
ncbi:hypothetical protein HDU91_005175 [Kappamyces sp. JEL0680]|nr:hypothetical protein HDU91_005175 [Kappamyces sp. JEL0680]